MFPKVVVKNRSPLAKVKPKQRKKQRFESARGLSRNREVPRDHDGCEQRM